MQYKQHAFILEIIESLHRHESRTGKTHVQKAISLLRDLGKVNVPFEFVLYRHGPYSFQVEEALEQMQSYDAIRAEPNAGGYGAVLRTGSMADFSRSHEALTEKEKLAVDEVCKFVARRNVLDLERLATASWIRHQEQVTQSDQVAIRLNTLKPHISIDKAETANAEIVAWLNETSNDLELAK